LLTSWKFWAGALLMAGLIALVESSYGWFNVLASWKAIPTDALVIAMSLMLLSYGLRAVRFYDFFIDHTRGHFLPLLRITVLHNFFNNLLPMRSGEAAFPLLMKQKFGLPIRHSAPALLWLRLLDLYALLALGFISLQSVLQLPPAWQIGSGIALLLAPMLALVLQGQVRTWLQRSQGHQANPSGLANKLLELMTAIPDHPMVFIRALFWTLINWALKLAVYAWLLGQFTGLELNAAWSGATTGELSSVLPIHGLAGAGTYEAGVLAGLLPWGIDQREALAAAVNLHLFVLGSTFALTGLLTLLTQRHR